MKTYVLRTGSYQSNLEFLRCSDADFRQLTAFHAATSKAFIVAATIEGKVQLSSAHELLTADKPPVILSDLLESKYFEFFNPPARDPANPYAVIDVMLPVREWMAGGKHDMARLGARTVDHGTGLTSVHPVRLIDAADLLSRRMVRGILKNARAASWDITSLVELWNESRKETRAPRA